MPTSYHDVSWQAIDNLDYPEGAPMPAKTGANSQLADIEPVEGVAVRVVGYLVAIKPQNGGSGEGTNCKFNKVGDVDFHLAIVSQQVQQEKTNRYTLTVRIAATASMPGHSWRPSRVPPPRP